MKPFVKTEFVLKVRPQILEDIAGLDPVLVYEGQNGRRYIPDNNARARASSESFQEPGPSAD